MEQPKGPQHQPAGLPASMRARAATAPHIAVPGAAAAYRRPTPQPPTPKGKKSVTFAMVGIGVVCVIVVVAAMLMGFQKFLLGTEVKADKYQAVFLSNNLWYFGKITDINGEYIKMRNIYYLQVKQDAGADKNSAANPQANQLTLTKLGNEIHGPEDVMYINRKQVVFWENLKDDGKVSQAIKNNEKK